MRLEDIGFYTLSDQRAKEASEKSPLWRCELILTDSCNFKCPYCRGLRSEYAGTLSLNEAYSILDIWISEGLKNVRFSGGEPTLYPELGKLVRHCSVNGVKRIAISTNGSASTDLYMRLVKAGANDFSISLDGGCCSVAEVMSGGKSRECWDRIVDNIRSLSKVTYVTTGMVFTEDNVDQCVEAVQFADSLGVSDIRVIPAAQYNKALDMLSDLPESFLSKYPILRYRINNIRTGSHVRGINSTNKFSHCWLGLDDMAVANDYHFPCIIYMREGGHPVGKVTNNIRQDRLSWVLSHDPNSDYVCKNNCLDVCVQYNAKVEENRLRAV